VPTVTAAPTDLRPAFVYAHDKDYVLDHNGVRRVLRELSRVAPRHDFLVCNLSEGSMTLEVLNTLPSKLESVCGSQIVALATPGKRSSHCWITSWESTLFSTLTSATIGFPALETLKQERRLSEKFKSFGNRLSLLGFDSNPFTGNSDKDYWLRNARAFKQEAYGCRYTED